MTIPAIEELDSIGISATGKVNINLLNTRKIYLTAIRDAVVAACRPQLRHISEMPAEVPEGCERHLAWYSEHCDGWAWNFGPILCGKETHYIDIALPADTYPPEFEERFAKSNIDKQYKDGAYKLWEYARKVNE